MGQDKKIALFRISFTRNLQVFEMQSLQVFDLIRIRQNFFTGMILLLRVNTWTMQGFALTDLLNGCIDIVSRILL